MDAPTLLIGARLIAYVCAALLCGAALVRLRLESLVDSTTAGAALARARTVAVSAAAVLLGVRLVSLYAQTTWLFGPDEAISLETLGVMANQTAWGKGWWAQVATALTALLWLARTGARTSAGLTMVVSLLAAATIPATGHAGEAGLLSTTLGVQALHASAAATWVGGLAFLVMALLAHAQSPVAPSGAEFRNLVVAFSPIAIACVTTLVLTGALSAWWYVGSLDALVSSSYGRVLGGKLAAVALVAAAGYRNWKRVTPRLGSAAGTAALRQTTGAEFSFALLALLLTAVLVGMPMPMG